MNNILVIAKNTFKESIRDRILLTMTILGFLFMIFIFFAATISLDQGVRVVIDFALAGILLVGILSGILISANLMFKEMIGGTALLIFSKPLKKSQYIIGKYLGVVVTILLIVIVLNIIFVIGFVIQNKTWPNSGYFIANLATFLEIMIIIALGILFGSFSNPISASLYSFALFISGHAFSLILNTAQASKNMSAIIPAKIIYYILPNLEKFNLRNFAVYNLHISITEVLLMLAYALIYIILVLCLATLAVRKREF